MNITCTTIDAAMTVVTTLIGARLRSGRDFRTMIASPLDPPVTITVKVALPADVLRQIRTIANTAIR